MLYVRDMKSFPANCKVLIYGAGGRGQNVYYDIKSIRTDLKVLCFLDTIKSGSFLSLPVIKIDDYISRMNEDYFSDSIIVIASWSHYKIAKYLEHKGIANYYVFLNPQEPEPCCHMELDNLFQALSLCDHPSALARELRVIEDGICYSCAKFSSLYMRPTGLSPCCWMPDLVDVGDFRQAMLRHMEILGRLSSNSCKDINTFCLRCPELYATSSKPIPSKLRNVEIDNSTNCNLKCRYCRVVGTEKHIYYDYIGLLNYALDNNYFEKEFSFSWGGLGEPLLNKDFEDMASKLFALGAQGMIYTNSVIFSELIHEALLADQVAIYTSIDAGTRETYNYVRGADKYDIVWRNMEKYVAACPDKVIAKYIVTDDNCDEQNISGFIERCIQVGIRRICISVDFFEPLASLCVRQGLLRLARLAKANGLTAECLSAALPKDLIVEINSCQENHQVD